MYYPRNRKIQPEAAHHRHEDTKYPFTAEHTTKSPEELDSGSECSSDSSIHADNSKEDEIMEEMVKKIIGPD